MNFNQLSWGAVCFYYRSAGDNRYGRIMRDIDFISRLRKEPYSIRRTEFEEKVLLDHVNIENYDLLIGHNLAGIILAKIIDLQPEISFLQDTTILDCNLEDSEVASKINQVYNSLYSIHGLWLTGASKIAHLLNDRLFAILNLDISRYFRILDDNTNLLHWLRLTQQNAQEVTEDFHRQGYSGLPEEYLSDKLGYISLGYQKSTVKFLDEYFWLRLGDNLPIPPKWIPPYIAEED